MLRRIYFTGNNGYQNLKDFSRMINFLTFDNNNNNNNNRKVNSWNVTTGIYLQKIDCLALIMSNLGNGRVSIKFSNPVLAQQMFSSLYSNFILNL